MTDQRAVPRLELSVANRLEEIGRVNEIVNSFAEDLDLDTAVRRALNVVFDELLTNTITYGYQDNEKHVIEISLSESDGSLHVRIVDDGAPFNPFDVEEPDTELSVEDRPLGGLGVYLVRNVMDHASYERRGVTNVLQLEKRLKPSEEGTMHLSSEAMENATVIRLEGNLDTNTSSDAHEYVNRMIDDGAETIVVSLENVDFVSSAGLRILLATAKRLSGSGGSLRICGLNETVGEVFEISGFSTILNVFPSESEALSAS